MYRVVIGRDVCVATGIAPGSRVTGICRDAARSCLDDDCTNGYICRGRSSLTPTGECYLGSDSCCRDIEGSITIAFHYG